jgi:hypothetical protein
MDNVLDLLVLHKYLDPTPTDHAPRSSRGAPERQGTPAHDALPKKAADDWEKCL